MDEEGLSARGPRLCSHRDGKATLHWLAFPLISPQAINTRLDAVEWLADHPVERARLRAILGNVYDLERLNGRVAAGTASPRDLWFMRLSLEALPELLEELSHIEPLAASLNALGDTTSVLQELQSTLADDPPAVLKDGGVIRPGFNAELDEWTTLATEGETYLLSLEAREREETGISNLKVKFNRVFGYFIEVRRTQTDQVPDRYIRKQTLTNMSTILQAQEFEDASMPSLADMTEGELFSTLRGTIANYADDVAIQRVWRLETLPWVKSPTAKRRIHCECGSDWC